MDTALGHAPRRMTALRDILVRQIAATGPITLADYMTACLLHPEHGYYTTQDPLGRGGDFVTAPEVSQIFGELVGLCLAQSWLSQGAPAPFVLAELGPGRGTLMADLLRATRGVPGFHAAMRLHLVEASPVLRQAQSAVLHEAAPVWHDRVDQLPDGPLFLIANEFFDALPIRQFQRDGDGWRERVVGLSDDALALGLSDRASHAALDARLGDTEQDQIVETCAPAVSLSEHIGGRITQRGGTALIVDYGGWHAIGDTFQAISNHAYADPFAAPGQADLTAHVDFEAIAHAAPCAHSAMTSQGVFLERLGITPRAQKLAQRSTGDALQTQIAAHRRLTHPEEMGSLFKTLALYPHGATPPPGLEPSSVP